MKRVLNGFLAVSLLATAACSGAEPNPATDDSPTPASASGGRSPGSSSASGSAGGQYRPAAECLNHRYRLLRFVAVGGTEAHGTGEGGDVYATFSNQDPSDGSAAGGLYLLEGRGKDPIKVTLAGSKGDLTVDGTAEGTYELQGSQATFTSTTSAGSATLEVGGQTQKMSMADVVAIVAPNGSAQVACTDKVLTLTAQSVRFELARV